MKIEGMFFKYHGNDWKNSDPHQWTIYYADPSEKITAKKIGHKTMFKQRATIYACDQCPHTFYAD